MPKFILIILIGKEHHLIYWLCWDGLHYYIFLNIENFNYLRLYCRLNIKKGSAYQDSFVSQWKKAYNFVSIAEDKIFASMPQTKITI